MNIWLGLVLAVHVLVALGIIGLVLLQHGKGADVGAAFGSGASGSLFGASGSANFLSRTTAILAVIFFITSLLLTYLATHGARTSGAGVMDAAPASSVPAVPANTAPGSVPGSVVNGAPAVSSAAGKASESKTNDVPK